MRKIRVVARSELRESYLKVLHWFFAYPQKAFSLSDLVAATKISKTSANWAVTKLLEEGFLDREILGNLWRLTSNQKHPYHLTRKVPYHLNLICESGILEAIHQQVPNARAIILFGSYRKGDDRETSDIDIAVEVLDDKDLRIQPLGKLSSIGYRTDITVNLHVFSRNNINLNLFANIANGIVLEGFLEVRP